MNVFYLALSQTLENCLYPVLHLLLRPCVFLHTRKKAGDITSLCLLSRQPVAKPPVPASLFPDFFLSFPSLTQSDRNTLCLCFISFLHFLFPAVTFQFRPCDSILLHLVHLEFLSVGCCDV